MGVCAWLSLHRTSQGSCSCVTLGNHHVPADFASEHGLFLQEGPPDVFCQSSLGLGIYLSSCFMTYKRLKTLHLHRSRYSKISPLLYISASPLVRHACKLDVNNSASWSNLNRCRASVEWPTPVPCLAVWSESEHYHRRHQAGEDML
jgi:hypothetical protein